MASTRYVRVRPSLAAVVFAVLPFGAVAYGQGVPALPAKPPVTNPAPPKTTQKPPLEIAKAQKLFEQALRDQQAGRSANAIAGYEEVIRLAPNVYPAHMNLGLVYRQLGQLAQAEESFKRAAGLEPKNALPRAQLAFVYLTLRRYPEAKAEAARAVALDPKNSQARQALGAAHAGLKEIAAAEKQYREAARLAPQNGQLLVSWATTLGALKKKTEALAAIDAAIKADPGNFQAHMYRGILLQSDRDFKGAIGSYQRAAELEPKEAAPWFNMALCWQLQAKDSKNPATDVTTQEAISAYLHAIELAPKYVPAYINTARLYFALGNYRQATTYFQRAGELDPGNTKVLADTATAEFWASQMSRDQKEKTALRDKAEARFKEGLKKSSDATLFAGLGTLYMQSGQPEKAAEVYLQWTQKDPKLAAAWVALAKARDAQKKPVDAQAAYEKALAIDPKNPEAHMSMATYYESQNKLDQAAAQYQAILAQDVKNNDARRKLGQLYLRQNKTAEALAQFQEMKKFAPKDTAPYIAIATAFEREKKTEEALQEYRAMAAMNPKDSIARWYIARALESQKKYDEAVAEYRAIEKISPTDVFYVSNIPRLLELAGKKDEALAEYKRLTERDPKSVQFRSMYAAALAKEQKYAEAIREYEAILEQSSNSTWVYSRIGDAYRDQKRWEDARVAYRKALEKPGDAVDALNKIEGTFTGEGKPEGWFTFLQDWMTAHPQDRVALAKIEGAAAKSSKIPQLIDFLKGIAEKSASDPLFQLDYASLLYRNGRKDESMAAYRAAAKLRQDDFTTRVTLAGMYDQAGRIPDAITMYEEITNIKSVPPAQLVGFRIKLAALYEKNGQSQLALAQYRMALMGDPNNAEASAAVKRLGG